MHLNIEQILWAVILSGHLLLLIVLMGRDRTARFRWFTAYVALAAISLVANHLLHGKLTTIAFYWQSYSALALEAILNILVLVELARQIFASGKTGLIVKPNGWIGWTLVTVAISAGAIWAWGPWPTWQALNAQPGQLPLILVILTGMKGELFASILTVQAALLFRVFGARFGFGWRSHPQQIALGLSTNALAYLAVQGINAVIAHTVHPTSRAEYEHILKILANCENARLAIWFLVLVWWIVWLWRDEPGTPKATAENADAPAAENPDGSEASALEQDNPDVRPDSSEDLDPEAS